MQVDAEGKVALMAALQLYSTCPLRVINMRSNGLDPAGFVSDWQYNQASKTRAEQDAAEAAAIMEAAGKGRPPGTPAAEIPKYIGPGKTRGGAAAAKAQSRADRQQARREAVRAQEQALREAAERAVRGGPDGAQRPLPGGQLSELEQQLAQALNIARKLEGTRTGMHVMF